MDYPNSTPRILMVSPEFYDIEYGINPHMFNADGSLKTVDKGKALVQWLGLKTALENCGHKVDVLSGQPGLPDMVFSANQAFAFIDPASNEPCVLLGRPRAPERQPEIAHFKKYFESVGVLCFGPIENAVFEGNGDALFDAKYQFIWGGYGFRSELAAYTTLTSLTGLEVVPLQLVDPDFYHLDTCFFVLDNETVALVPEAFSPNSLVEIKERVPNILAIPAEEARSYFGGNSFYVGSNAVLVPEGNRSLSNLLNQRNYNVIPVDTSEFTKAGGSVFCLKFAYWR